MSLLLNIFRILTSWEQSLSLQTTIKLVQTIVVHFRAASNVQFYSVNELMGIYSFNLL